MFSEYNYFRRYNNNKAIEDYKEFYKLISNEKEFGGQFTHLDHWVKDRFQYIFGHMFHAVLRRMPKNILDIGCGNGRNLPLSLIFKNIQYFGIDYAEKTLEKAKELYPNVNFKLMDAFNLDFPDKTFDMVIMSCFLILYKEEKNQIALLNEAKRVMTNDGIFALIVLNENLFVKNSIYLSKLLAKFQNIPLPNDFSNVHFSFKDISNLTKKVGLRIEERINTGVLNGVLESVKYLNMKRYKREFGKEGESHIIHSQNFLKDLQNTTGSTVLVKVFFYIAKLFPNLFSLFSIYLISKREAKKFKPTEKIM